jgi:MiaB/RimO family radical SAM methylthiotransferase
MEYKVFGCKTNKYFAEKWLVHPHLEWKEWYFIASCVVTDRAKAKWVKHAKKILPKIQSNQKLYLSGCGNIRDGIVDPRFYEIYHELEWFKENIEILPEDPDDFIQTQEQKQERIKTKIRSLSKIFWKEIFTRKYMVIQTGCDNFCTFCLTVQARGRHKWRPSTEIVEEIRNFVEDGGKEVVFTGINLGAWWASSSNNYNESKIVELVSKVLSETPIERLRISSLWVEFCTPELIELFKNKRIIAYAHLSIQSASDQILRSMNRHYDEERLHRVLEGFRSIQRDDGKDLNIWADIIVGFPGEDEGDFEKSMEIVKKYQIAKLHAFPFSPHIDHYSVPAGSFESQIPNHIIHARQKKLLRLWEEVALSWAGKTLGKEVSIVVEKVSNNSFSGWTENYLFCNERNFEPHTGQTITRGTIVKGIYKEILKGKEDE